MNTKHFFVVKKSSGMNIKRFSDEASAKAFAAKCIKANNAEFIVCINAGGYFQEI